MSIRNGYSHACSKYGADMGRRAGDTPLDGELCKLHRVPLDSGGYDPGGAYWGAPQNLWRLQCDGGDHFVRAATREAAWWQLCYRFSTQIRVRS